MSDNLFDKFIKDKLENHSSAYPADMWQKIKPQKESKKRGAWWWTSGLILLITALAGFGLYFNNKLNTSKNAGHAVLNNGEPVETKEPLKETKSSNVSQLGLQPSVTDHDGIATAGKEKENPSAGTGIIDSKEYSPKSNGNISRSARKKDNATAVDDIMPGGSLTLNNSLPRFKGSKSSIGKHLYPSLPLTELNSNIIDPANQYTRSIFDIAKEEAKAKGLLNAELLKQLEKYKPSSPVGCPPSRLRNRRDTYVEFFTSPEYAKKTVIKGSGISDDYLKSKDSVESIRAAFTAGIRIDKMLGQNLVLKTGLQYSQINEKFDYRSPTEKRLLTVITIRMIIRGPNDTLKVSDTSTVEQTGYRVVKAKNRYHSVDIPVILGYEFGGERLKVGINAGVILNVYSWQRGQTLDSNRAPIAFNHLGDSQGFKSNIGLGIYAGVSLLKKVNDNIEIFAEPYFRYNMSNMTKDKNPFAQKFSITGMNLGIRYKLSGSR